MTESFEVALTKCNETTLKNLQESTLLSESDMRKLEECLPAARDAFNKTQMFRTQTEMRISVLNDVGFPTADAKYWQSIREMNVMTEQLIMLSFTYKEKLLDLKELKLAKGQGLQDIALERNAVATQRKEFEIACIQREAHHRIREIAEWKKILDELTPVLGAGTEDVDHHQLFSLTLRFLQEYQIAESQGVNKDLDSYRNLRALVQTSVSAIERAGLMPSLMKTLDQNRILKDFCRKKNLIK